MGFEGSGAMRLTAHLISQCPQFVNCVREWELDCRGNRIPIIENLGSTEDQFDTINLCDNEIAKLDNFPKLLRLKTLLCCNNRIARIDASLADSLLELTDLVLTNNHLKHLADIDALAGCEKLRSLVLADNDITKKRHYKSYVIHMLPQLKRSDHLASTPGLLTEPIPMYRCTHRCHAHNHYRIRCGNTLMIQN